MHISYIQLNNHAKNSFVVCANTYKSVTSRTSSLPLLLHISFCMHHNIASAASISACTYRTVLYKTFYDPSFHVIPIALLFVSFSLEPSLIIILHSACALFGAYNNMVTLRYLAIPQIHSITQLN